MLRSFAEEYIKDWFFNFPDDVTRDITIRVQLREAYEIDGELFANNDVALVLFERIHLPLIPTP